MRLLLVLPIVLPLLTASLCLLAWRRPRVQHALSVAGALGLLGVSAALLDAVWRVGIVATQPGNWPAPFGITLVADLLSATMTLLAALAGLAVVVYSGATIDSRRVAFGYYPIMQILLMGVCGAFPDRRHLQPLRVVRGDADGLLRPARVGRRARAA
jgi:multicomponent Na+:H+ antiporter subunit D